MTSVLFPVSLLALFAIAGCASSSGEAPTSDVSFALNDGNGVWQALPVGRGPHAEISRESMSGKPGDTTKSRTHSEPDTRH